MEERNVLSCLWEKVALLKRMKERKSVMGVDVPSRLRVCGFRSGSEALLSVPVPDITRFTFLDLLAVPPGSPFVLNITSQEVSQRPTHNLPQMSSPVVSPVPRPAEFQAHIYNSFLQGRTSDVALRIRGSWDATYKFHRVVLIQAVGALSHLSL
jgi:hypothetical protein